MRGTRCVAAVTPAFVIALAASTGARQAAPAQPRFATATDSEPGALFAIVLDEIGVETDARDVRGLSAANL